MQSNMNSNFNSTSRLNSEFNTMNLGTTTTTSTFSETVVAPTTVVSEVILEAPVVRETIKPEERFNIQEQVERDIHQTEIKKVIQPIVEKEVNATQVHYNTLPTQHREFVHTSERDMEAKLRTGMSELQSTRVVAPTVELGTTERGAIVHEHYDKKIIEQVQPIIYREIVQPHIVETVQPIQETIYSAPVLLSDVEVRAPIYQAAVVRPEIIETREFIAPVHHVPVAPPAPKVVKAPKAPKMKIPKQTHLKHVERVAAPVVLANGPIVTPVITTPAYGLGSVAPIANSTFTTTETMYNTAAVRGVDHIPSSDPALVQGNAHVFPTTVNGVPVPTIGVNPNLPPASNPLINSALNKGMAAPMTSAHLGKQSAVNRPTIL